MYRNGTFLTVGMLVPTLLWAHRPAPTAVPIATPPQAATRDTVTVVPTLAPKNPLPAEAASAAVTKFSFIVYGDTRGRHDGTALQAEHQLVVESMLATIKTAAGPDAIRFVLQSGDAVVNGALSCPPNAPLTTASPLCSTNRIGSGPATVAFMVASIDSTTN